MVLTGCMQALETGQRTDVAPPSVPPAPTQIITASPPASGVLLPTGSGSLAPDPGTATSPVPTEPVQAPATSEAMPATPLPPLALPTPTPLSYEERWRSQQIDRLPFEAPRPFVTTGSELWWFDPVNQQSVILGRIAGEFQGQAEFTLRGQGVRALEVPYNVNVSYGLTALSPALLDRIRAAGYTEWIETYVFLTPNVTTR